METLRNFKLRLRVLEGFESHGVAGRRTWEAMEPSGADIGWRLRYIKDLLRMLSWANT
jgi:hypothetical protein